MHNLNELKQELVAGNSSVHAPQRLFRCITPSSMRSIQEFEHRVSRKRESVDSSSVLSELESDTDSGEN
jgi:hypothetical protein